eukprot:m.699083 g.699083  ORF g.699083 m.699083 type:complete len:221 (-) comp58688_c0_seq47:1028-1690(-)
MAYVEQRADTAFGQIFKRLRRQAWPHTVPVIDVHQSSRNPHPFRTIAARCPLMSKTTVTDALRNRLSHLEPGVARFDLADVSGLYDSSSSAVRSTLSHPSQWRAFQLPNKPGFIVLRDPFTPAGQREWAQRCLCKYANSSNVCNLDAHHYDGHGQFGNVCVGENPKPKGILAESPRTSRYSMIFRFRIDRPHLLEGNECALRLPATAKRTSRRRYSPNRS